MKIEYDPTKDQQNIDKHGISLAEVSLFEFDAAMISADERHDYREARWNAIGPIGNRLYHLTFTHRGDAIRPISLRKANKREVLSYVRDH